jgi:hypothetical protein
VLQTILSTNNTGIYAYQLHSQFLKYDELAIVMQILSHRQEPTKQGCILEAAIEAGAKELIGLKDSLNDWDSKVGDGDCGTTVGLAGVC